MAYVKQNWENLPSTNTPITAERLNHMEDGIAEAWEHGGGSGAGETLRIGTILPFTGSSSELPTGYMLCDGAELSRTDYSDLFAVIGTSFGAGNGSSTFNLPNLKGKVLTGLDSNDEDFASMGATGGEKEHTLTIEEMPSHKHTWTLGANVVANATATSAVTNFNSTSGGLGVATMNNTGGSQPHSILQPYVVVNYIIKVTQSAPVQAQIVGTETESDIDGYSCNFLNGAIIEDSGTGYIRFGDGTQICYGITTPSAVPNNNVCTGSETFAKEFTTNPTVITSLSGTLSNASNELTINVKVSGITTTYFTFSEHSSGGAFGTAERRMVVHYLAIGRWK